MHGLGFNFVLTNKGNNIDYCRENSSNKCLSYCFFKLPFSICNITLLLCGEFFQNITRNEQGNIGSKNIYYLVSETLYRRLRFHCILFRQAFKKFDFFPFQSLINLVGIFLAIYHEQETNKLLFL